MSDPLLAGLSRDPDYCVAHLCSPPSLSITSVNERGSFSVKALDCMTHWSRNLEPEILTAGPKQAVKCAGWQKEEWDLVPQPHEDGISYSNSDLHKEHCHDQDLVKRNHSTAKVMPAPALREPSLT
ncbi:coiled-coil domain-containing protein 159-like isoform X2 [Acomys russatus]|uniref:coiled-coil domain-containing protein 159-like isoform X2 n=1 Tax=Acomys russatus TaxID=60746 RepID=UPI0021E1E183|nr:coiled-coil domain-containing protein 159-like isoform X2 [Acomys russatus]